MARAARHGETAAGNLLQARRRHGIEVAMAHCSLI
jgi:hypothetical protein